MKRWAHENLNNYRLEDKNKDNKESKKIRLPIVLSVRLSRIHK